MRDYELITRREDLGRVARLVSAAEVIGLDIETYKLPGQPDKATFDPRLGKIRLVQLNVDDDHIFVLDLMQLGGLGQVRPALRDTKAIFVIHNAKFEQKWFWHCFGIELWPVFCTFRASALIYNGKLELRHNIDTVVERELGEVVENTGQGESDWGRPNLTKLQLDYAAEDVIRLPRLRKALKDQMERCGLLYTGLIEFGVCLAEGDIELRGFPLDAEAWETLAKAKIKQRRVLKEELLYELPHPEDQLALPGLNAGWNLDSQPMMLKSLHKLGLRAEDEETGKLVPIADTSHLTLAQHLDRSEIVKLLEYRHVGQRVKTFGLDFLKWVEGDGRIHTSYWSMLVSGRYSSSKPNLQQIPRDAAYRGCFRAPNGRVFVLADYAGIEMRIAAEIARDGRLIEVFRKGEDAHFATASLVARKPVDKITKTERQQAKAVNFGFIYGMGPKKFVVYALGNYGVVLTLREAEQFHKRYFDGYSGIKRWHGRVLRDGQRSGISRTLSGRLRYLDPRKNYNEFFNNPVQGTGADALKLSLRHVNEKLRHPKYGGRAYIVHHVHDEIIVECDDDKDMIAAVKQDLEEGMIEGMSPFLKLVPIVVEANHGPTWADAK